MNRGIELNSTKFSVMEASKAFKKSRTTIYDALKSGELSRDSNGLIDLSELIRVYGNPLSVQSSTRTEQVHIDVQSHVQFEVENLLKEQISLLKNQLDIANQREKSLMQHIEDLTHRIEFKGTLESSVNKEKIDPQLEKLRSEPEHITENPRIPIPTHNESEEPKKRGFWSRFFLPNG